MKMIKVVVLMCLCCAAVTAPAKCVAKKEEYLKMFDGFLATVDVAVAAFGTRGTEARGGK